MAGPRKKRTIESKSESSASENESENMDIDTTIEADFEGRNPDAADFHGIQQLLKQLFLKAHINVSQLSDMIIAQQGVGSVLKQSVDNNDDDDDEDDDDLNNPNDVFGVTTVLNLTSNKNNESVQQIYNTVKDLANKHAEESVNEQLNNILTDHNKIGLLLNERFINIPAKIADPLLDSLQNELERITKKNPSYNFDYFIMICKTYKKLNKDKKDEGFIFINAEEEVFAKNSDVVFEFSVENESDTGVGGLWTEDDKQMIPHRKVLLFNAKNLAKIVQCVKKFVA